MTASAIGTAVLEDDISYDQYGDINTPSKYKLQQYHGRDDVITTILWGYDGQYPVAKVIGADLATVQALVDQTMLDNAKNYTDAQIRTELNKIRTGLTSPLVQVVTNTYKPLIGVSSTTDAKGLTTYYEYDSSGRLIHVKDKDGNVISRTDYHYKGQ